MKNHKVSQYKEPPFPNCTPMPKNVYSNKASSWKMVAPEA